MKKIILVITLITLSISLFAQKQTVKLNSAKQIFDDGKELPSEEAFIVMVEISRQINFVTLEVFGSSNTKKEPLYSTSWTKTFTDAIPMASLTNNYKLRAGSDYTFVFQEYRNIGQAERDQVAKIINTSIDAIINNSVKIDSKNRYQLLKSPGDILLDMNEYLVTSSTNYAGKGINESRQFSTIIRDAISLLDRANTAVDTTNLAASTRLSSLQTQLKNEILQIVNSYYYVLNQQIIVQNYPVENKKRSIALNFGYGGVLKNENFNSTDYYSAPYAGLSFPLGNKNFSGSFWSRTSVSAGVFLKNFTSDNGLKITGPLVGLPLYGGIGHKFLRMFKVNAGVAILEEKNTLGTNSSSAYLRPFAGLSLELNMWLGFGDK